MQIDELVLFDEVVEAYTAYLGMAATPGDPLEVYVLFGALLGMRIAESSPGFTSRVLAGLARVTRDARVNRDPERLAAALAAAVGRYLAGETALWRRDAIETLRKAVASYGD